MDDLKLLLGAYGVRLRSPAKKPRKKLADNGPRDGALTNVLRRWRQICFQVRGLVQADHRLNRKTKAFPRSPTANRERRRNPAESLTQGPARSPMIDWERAEQVYRDGKVSIREIARREGVSEGAVRAR